MNIPFVDLQSQYQSIKAEADAAAFSDWGRAVSGRLGQPTGNGFEVVEAGVRIFEKKPKEAATEVVAAGV